MTRVGVCIFYLFINKDLIDIFGKGGSRPCPIKSSIKCLKESEFFFLTIFEYSLDYFFSVLLRTRSVLNSIEDEDRLNMEDF